MNSENANCFIGDLAGIVPPANLIHNPLEFSEYAVLSGSPFAVVFPENKEQVKQIVQSAGKLGIALMPMSSGLNHAQTGAPGSREWVIVNFSRMKKIIKIDAVSRYAWIEPGVTFGELIPELKKHGQRLNAPFLPLASKSVIASLLEREPVLIPKYQYDYVDPLLTVEVVYGTGDDFRTGSASGPGPLEQLKADKVNPWGPGSIDYMRFLTGAQGTMGFVTWAIIKTEILPTLQKSYVVSGESLKTLTDLTNKLLAKRVVDECLILNNVNLASILAGDEAEYAQLKKALPHWTLITRIAGYDRYPEQRVRIQEKYLKEICSALGLSPDTEYSDLAGQEEMIMDRLSGVWDEEIYWKNRFKGDSRDIFFLSPPSRASEFTDIFLKTVSSIQYPEDQIGVYIQPLVQGRGYHVEFNLFYDGCDAKETAAADRLFTAASETMLNAGAFFSRPYGKWADMVFARYGEGVAALKKLKSIFDPENILNPGKLCF